MRLGSGKKYMHTYFSEQNIFQSFYFEKIKDNIIIVLIQQDPQCTFIVEKLNNSSVNQEISRFVCNPKFHYSATRAPFVFALSQIFSVHFMPTYILDICFDIILPKRLRFSKTPPSFRSAPPKKNPVYLPFSFIPLNFISTIFGEKHK